MTDKKQFDSLEFREFTAKAEMDKAIHTLKGILQGIKLDGSIDKDELKELKTWCNNYAHFINRNPLRDFLLSIRYKIERNEFDLDAAEDLYWLCQKFENDNIYYNALTSGIQELHGICHGILANGVVHDEEVHGLKKWIDDNDYLSSYYPYDELNSLITMILKDGIVDERERAMLKAYFYEFADLSREKTAIQIERDIEGITIDGLCTLDPNVEFKDRTFCFTGVSKIAPRIELIERVTVLGGLYAKQLTKKTNYLIVGDNGNKCWAFASYGRKVEQALSLRKQGADISIVHEFDFWDFVEDAS